MKSLKKTETFTFLIKGTHLEMYNSEDPYINLLFPYFISRENFLMIFNTIDDKNQFYNELLKFLGNKKYIVVTDNNMSNIGNITEYEHVIYLNTIPMNHISDNHASIIIDYTHLALYYNKSNDLLIKIFDHKNANWYKNILNSIISSVEIKELTLVCQKPNIQKINFIFAQTKELKITTINFLNRGIENISKHSNLPIKKIAYVCGIDTDYSNVEEYKFIETIPHIAEFSDIVIADFDLNIFEESLTRFNTVTLIYTPEDFIHFRRLIDSCNKFNFTVPDYIIKIADKQKV